MDEYLQSFPKDAQSILEKIMLTIRKVAPEAKEAISYQMPIFKLKGNTLAHFAAFRKHVGLFPPPPREFKKEVWGTMVLRVISVPY
jgi:uncharacterized protein YdhG (YjbR/CyaY superfamily)